MEDPLCDSSFGSMVTLDYVTPDTRRGLIQSQQGTEDAPVWLCWQPKSGRWLDETANFLSTLSKAKGETVPEAVRDQVRAAWLRCGRLHVIVGETVLFRRLQYRLSMRSTSLTTDPCGHTLQCVSAAAQHPRPRTSCSMVATEVKWKATSAVANRQGKSLAQDPVQLPHALWHGDCVNIVQECPSNA